MKNFNLKVGDFVIVTNYPTNWKPQKALEILKIFDSRFETKNFWFDLDNGKNTYKYAKSTPAMKVLYGVRDDNGVKDK